MNTLNRNTAQRRSKSSFLSWWTLPIAALLLSPLAAPSLAADRSDHEVPRLSLGDLGDLFDGAAGRSAGPSGSEALTSAIAAAQSGPSFKDKKCVDCHRKFGPEAKGLHPIITSWGCDACHVDAHLGPQQRYKWLSTDLTKLCVRCHGGKEFNNKTQHSPVTFRMCTTCHDPHVSEKGYLLTSDEPLLCFDCHKSDRFLRRVRHSPAADGTCSTCHRPHSTESPKLLVKKGVCFSCHDKDEFAGGKVVHAPVQSGDCARCHDPHSSDQDKLLVAGDLCVQCHKPEAFQGASVHSPVASRDCSSCHRPHKSEARKLLTKDTPGLCFTCHDEREYKGKKVVHYPVKSGECASCHSPHAGAAPFLMTAAKICFECHDEKEFDGTGKHIKADHRWCVGCHNPHQSDHEHLLRKKR
ncbi:MAG: hypothetical protein HY927_07460 [Elusimicrobia bacterium]|nr:hypothetical protein [Elusimicrobiota bacterium]